MSGLNSFGKKLLGALGALLGIQDSAERNAYLRHYTTAERAALIAASGEILRSADGFTYVTPDFYTSGAEAQAKLSLSTTPEGYLMVPIRNIETYHAPSTVQPGYGQPGGGTEIRVPHDISSEGTRWMEIGP